MRKKIDGKPRFNPFAHTFRNDFKKVFRRTLLRFICLLLLIASHCNDTLLCPAHSTTRSECAPHCRCVHISYLWQRRYWFASSFIIHSSACCTRSWAQNVWIHIRRFSIYAHGHDIGVASRVSLSVCMHYLKSQHFRSIDRLSTVRILHSAHSTVQPNRWTSAESPLCAVDFP